MSHLRLVASPPKGMETLRFRGDRLRLARERRWLSQWTLGRYSGIPAPRIRTMEADMAVPTARELRVLGAVLGFPPSFFIADRPAPKIESCSFQLMVGGQSHGRLGSTRRRAGGDER